MHGNTKLKRHKTFPNEVIVTNTRFFVGEGGGDGLPQQEPN